MIDNLATLYPQCKIDNGLKPELLIEADKNQLEQVLINLFKNAVEAMGNLEEKTIEVSFSQEGNWQHISIRDYGTGIANLDNIFVPFYTTKPQGSGIGLALCRQIMFNHNGLIKIDNYSSEHSNYHLSDDQNISQSDDAVKQGVEVVLSLPYATSNGYNTH